MNKVILLGRLTKDPEVRYSQGGAEPLCVTRYTLAVNKRFKREGEPDADFINCVVFGKQGEFAEKYFKKGMLVAVSGRIQVRTYVEPQFQQTRWITEVVLDEQEFAESKASFEARSQSSGGHVSAAPQAPVSPEHGHPVSQPANKQRYDAPSDGFYIDNELNDDDLPF